MTSIYRHRSFGKKLAMAFCAVFLLLILVSVPLFSVFFRASVTARADQNLSEIQYKVIEIKKGESLWSIAQDNIGPGFSDIYDYMEEIRICNQLKTDYITSGSYLMLPYYETEGF